MSGSTALSILQRRSGTIGLLPSPEDADSYPFSAEERAYVRESMSDHVIGDPATVLAGLEQLLARTGADELMLSTRTHSYDARANSFKLLAKAWGLGDSVS